MTAPSYVLAAVDEHVALNAFYHATHSNLPVGKIIEHWGGSKDDNTDLVDRLRPERVRPRLDHFFLVDDPKCLPALGRDNENLTIYEVEPKDLVGPLNYGWLDGLSRIERPTRRHFDRVRRYWAGVSGEDSCKNEYIAERMLVKRELGTLGEYLTGMV